MSSPAVVIPMVSPSVRVAEPRDIAVHTSSLATWSSSKITIEGCRPWAVATLAPITLYIPVPSLVQRPRCSVDLLKKCASNSDESTWCFSLR